MGYAPVFGPVTPDSDYSFGATNYTVRQIINSSAISKTGLSSVKLVIYAHSAAAFTIAKMYIGEQAASGDVYDFASAPTAVLFSGNASTGAVSAGSSITSDAVAYVIPASKNIIVSFYFAANDGNFKRNGSYASGEWWSKASVDEAATANVTGYSQVALDLVGLMRIDGLYLDSSQVITFS